MSSRVLITPSEVVEYAFTTGEYVAEGVISEPMILAAQIKYITPILGEELQEAILEGGYLYLKEEYVAPTLAILTRTSASLAAYPPTEEQRERGQIFLRWLTDYLNTHSEEYEEYHSAQNPHNRCSTLGGIVL